MKKRGMSQVVGTVIIVTITVIATAAVFGVIRAFVQDSLNDTGKCHEILEEIRFNTAYTCVSTDANGLNPKVRIALERKEKNLDSILISVSSNTSSKSFKLNGTAQIIPGVTNYDGKPLKMPGKEGGDSYCVVFPGDFPSQVNLAPKAQGVQCDIMDTIRELKTCRPQYACP